MLGKETSRTPLSYLPIAFCLRTHPPEPVAQLRSEVPEPATHRQGPESHRNQILGASRLALSVFSEVAWLRKTTHEAEI
jgi:hypothetical protein